jgi:PAS domain S-box-containing protein
MIRWLTGFQARRFTRGLTALLLFSAVFNLAVLPIRGTVTGISRVMMPWGEEISVLAHRGIAWYTLILYAGALLICPYALVAARRLRSDPTTRRLFSIAIGAWVLSAVLNAVVDLAGLPAPYLGGLTGALFALLFSSFLSREYGRRSETIAAGEEQLHASEARNRTLIEWAPDAIVVIDVADGCFTDFNQHAIELFGVPAEQLRRLSPTDVSPPLQPDGRASRTAALEHIQAAVAGAKPVFFWTHRGPAGREIPCQIWLVRLPDPTRVLIRGSIIDITERVRLEDQLRQSQKVEAMGQLAAGVAHDFNNLLTVISGYSGMLLDQLPPQDPRRAHVRAISDAAEQSAWLTERLLAFSRRAVLVPRVVDVNNAMRETERLLRRIIGEDIRLSAALDVDAGHILIDPGQWSQVLLNLTSNARDAMPTGGELTIGASHVDVDARFVETHTALRPGPHVRLFVADSGSGMTPDVKARLFEPFFTTKDLGKGTGLGLAVVHGIVTAAGGCIDLESEPGRGTTFTIYLPAVTPPGIHHSPGQSVPGETALATKTGETILLVEDEEGVRDIVALALRQQGFSVVEAVDGVEALRIVDGRADAIDLLCTDVVMPRMGGRDLANTLQAKFPRLKVLFLSGYTDDVRLRHGVFGADEDYLQKPFAMATLGRKVREMIDRP